MKLNLLAILGVAATVYAQDVTGDDVEVNELYKGPIGFPPGVATPPPKFLPHKPPPVPKPLPIWHPPHKGIFIDDCDDEDDEEWHWAWNKHGDKPHGPPHKWITTTVTVTKTKTVGPPETAVEETVCPVPVTEEPHPPAKPTKDWPEPPAPAPEPPVEEPAPEPTPEPTKPAPPAPEPPVVSEEPDVSAAPEPPVEIGAAGRNAAGVLAAVAAVVAALF